MTIEEIEKLKNDWLSDPCFYLEETEGVENYKDELLQFRLQKEKEWKEIREKEIKKKCTLLGLKYPDHSNLIIKLESLESRILYSETIIDDLQNKLYENGIN